MSIQNGNIADADEVMNAFGSNFNDTAQNIFNADYIGFDSRLGGDGTPNLKNVDFDTFQTDSMTINGNIEYDSTNDYYFGPSDVNIADFVVYDDANNSSIDAGKWTVLTDPQGETATVIENGTYQELNSSTNDNPDPSCSSTSNSLDLNTHDYLMIDLPLVFATSNDNAKSANSTISFGGVNILVASANETTVNLVNNKINIMKLGNNYKYKIFDGSVWGLWVNFSPASEVLKFSSSVGATASGGVGTSTLRFNLVRFNTLATSNSSTTDFITSTGHTSSSTITNSITVVNSSGDGILIETAADGLTFESVTNTEIHRPSATGTNSKTRIKSQGINIISEYATKNNFY